MRPISRSDGLPVSTRVRLSSAMALLVLAPACGGSGENGQPGPSRGGIGQECNHNGTCNVGGRCIDGTCTACEPGVEGCLCRVDSPCDVGLECRSATCQHVSIPASVACYTPCREGIQRDDGSYVACGADGLMLGCLAGAVCRDGACETDPDGGSEAPTEILPCYRPSECPDFQECVANRCRTTCDEDGHCPQGQQCFRHTCRYPCDTDASRCPDGQFCSLQDGETGFCTAEEDSPRAEPVQGVAPLPGTFGIDHTSIRFNARTTEASFVITNNSPASLTFTVTKSEHVEYADGGRVVVRTNPLSWLAIGQSHDASQVASYGVEVSGNGGTVAIKIAGAENLVLRRWRGVLQVEAPQLGRQAVNLEYVGDPNGQWTGQLYFYANFPRENLANWITLKESGAGTSTLVGAASDVLRRINLVKTCTATTTFEKETRQLATRLAENADVFDMLWQLA
ncbi:MAG: hypothetical protein AAB426_09240 [Myxococcota bacterium]